MLAVERPAPRPLNSVLLERQPMRTIHALIDQSLKRVDEPRDQRSYAAERDPDGSSGRAVDPSFAQ
jgi:hypothetical protein